MKPIPIIIHATHEAGVKVGGIGAVFDGLLSAPAYATQVGRTILAGPLNANDAVEMEHLLSAKNGLKVRYGSLQGIFGGVSSGVRAAIQAIEEAFQIAILYGTRRFGAYEHEVLLVDASNPNVQEADAFKYYVWEEYGIDSARYDWNPEFNLYFTIAQPLLAALHAIGAGRGQHAGEKFIIAHEWMGLPLVFAAQMAELSQAAPLPEWRTIFYAHETATARWLVEEDGGHDTRFYNVLAKANEWGMNLEAVFGSQDQFFKDSIIRQATRCDNVFAVGDLIIDELRFLGRNFAERNIDLVYNGVPSVAITLAEKLESKRRLQQYCENLLGYQPDYVFTHVTRLVPSKALWRDLRVLENLDPLLHAEGKQAVLFVLSTSLPAGRRSEWVRAWEEQYGWPVGHRGDNGDLIGGEEAYFFDGVEPFNASAGNAKVVFINQFGWSQERCGVRMPADMEFMDIRKGSDLEFGQSIYEPFGIAQVEPLGFGTISCVSNVCGCVGFVRRAYAQLKESTFVQKSSDSALDSAASGAEFPPNFVIADYTRLPEDYQLHSPHDALWIDRGLRDQIEAQNSVAVARTIFERLPRSAAEAEALLHLGQALAQRMSWDVVAKEYLLPGLQRAKRE